MDLMDPNDNEKLKEDVKALKLELNHYKDGHRILLAKTEQYKRRATYAKTKYYEIKHSATNLQAQQPSTADSKYRLKNTELKQQIKKLTLQTYKLADDAAQWKSKLVQALQLNKMQREEGEKVSRQMKRLVERLEMLERREEERYQFEEVRG